MIFAPSDFARDPYGYVTNQAGHAYLVGMPFALALAPWLGLIPTPIIAALVYGVVWEVIIQRGRMWRDSFEDSVHVLAGASVLCAALLGDWWAVAGCFAAQAGLLGLGAWRRS